MIQNVLYVGDSRKKKGGVSAVIRVIETTFLWQKYHCDWLECQINSSLLSKAVCFIRAIFQGLYTIPKFGILHFHTALGNSMLVQLPFFLYAKLLRKKVIVQFHVGDQMKKASNSHLFRFFCKNADLIITLGDSLRKYVPAAEEKVTFLYNPAPPVSIKNPPQKYFLFSAFIDKALNKGYDVLIEAFASFLKLCPDWRLVICGDGDMDQLHQLIEKFGIADSIETPGWITGDAKDLYFRNAFAYCLASRQEGLPVVVLESLSYGLPVIATPVGCLPELLENEQTVLFTVIGDSASLVQQMTRLTRDRTLYEKLSHNSIDLVRQRLSVERFAEKLDSIYQDLSIL